MKKYIKLIAADVAIAVIAIILYSPGLVNLRPGDASIFRAGMSIIAGLALAGSFFFINLRVLFKPKPALVGADEVSSLDKAKSILGGHVDSKYFGSYAKTASGQLDRILKSQKKLSDLLDRKFTKGTMSYDKFFAIVKDAENSTIKNVVVMANRMSIFDEEEYNRLQHYKEDDIPDDIQEEQLKLYKDNFDAVKSVIALNEKLLLKLDALAIELSSFEVSETQEMNSDILVEIEKLIEETKYYQ